MSTSANFFSTPRTASGLVSTANPNRDGSGTVPTIMTAAASGTRIDDIEIQAFGATSAGVFRLYLNDGAGNRMVREILVTAITPSTTVAAFNARVTDLAWILQNASWSLRASTEVANSFNIFVTRAGDA